MFNNIYFIICCALLHITMSVGNRKEGHYRSFNIDENLIMKRCELKFCINSNQANCSFTKCMERMLLLNKFGNCPSKPATALEAVCIDTCDGSDYKCSGIAKCCSHECGRTCQKPQGIDLLSDSFLPPRPKNITVITLENHKHGRRTAEISWQMDWYTKSERSTVYIVEARAHTGYLFLEYKLSNWFNINFYMTSHITYPIHGHITSKLGANIRLRPGRWYQFRIASINENGTRGYSNNSHIFQLKERPKNPLPPRNFTIATMPKLLENNTVYTKATWKHPRSDYPVEKYKITWSLYLEANNGSLWLNEAYIQEPARFFEFWDLKPNSLYYLQLQALSTFGQKRLKSPKEAVFINTTIPANIIWGSRQTKNIDNIPNIFIRFVGSKKYGLVVKIIWTEHFIGSTLELCIGYPHCFGKQSLKKFKIRTKKNHFESINLKYETRYSVRLKNLKNAELVKTFLTPSCEHFAEKHTHLILKCS